MSWIASTTSFGYALYLITLNPLFREDFPTLSCAGAILKNQYLIKCFRSMTMDFPIYNKYRTVKCVLLKNGLDEMQQYMLHFISDLYLIYVTDFIRVFTVS